MKTISILGSTGSIGVQTLDIVTAFPDRFQVFGLSAGANIDLLFDQIKAVHPKAVCVRSREDRNLLQDRLTQAGIRCELYFGDDGLIQIATASENNLLVVAIVGTASLRPTYEAIKCGIPIGLACKEVLVAAGDCIMDLARHHQVPVLPIDSEHAALKQCLAAVDEDLTQVSRLILTASGGPFRTWSKEALSQVTLEEALKHPNWTMGPKITIDSATMMNKGLEIIEAHHLFNCPYEKLDVIVHPQSIVHSLVEFTDGTMLAQMGLPDMRFPIQYVLTYPEKWPNPWPKSNLAMMKNLEFFDPDYARFPLLKLAFDAGKQGGTAPAVMNAANEAAVSLVLNRQLAFTDISPLVHEIVATYDHWSNPTIEELLSLDADVKDQLYALHRR